MEDIVEITGWSKSAVYKMIDEPDFPRLSFGKKYLVEASAFKEYCKKRRGC